MSDTREVVIAGQKVVIDSKKLLFNEATLSQYLEQEGAWYDYFGQVLADAEYELSKAEEDYDRKYSIAFRICKEEGSSDKLSEAGAKCDTDVQNANVKRSDAKYKVKLIQQHLRAWDKNHDNAQSRGHTLRKEMDKLSGRIYGPVNHDEWQNTPRIEDVVKSADQQNLDNLPN